VVDFLERRQVPRTRAIITVFVGAVVIMLALASSVVPQVISETRVLATRIPGYAESVRTNVVSWINHPPTPLRKLFGRILSAETTNAPVSVAATNAPEASPSTNAVAAVSDRVPEPIIDWSKIFGTDAVKSVADWFARTAPKIGAWFAGQVSRVASLFGLLAGLALVPVYAFYFLLEKRGIESRWTDYLPVSKSGFKDELVFVIKAINDHLVSFFRGQVLVAICDGICYTIGFLIIGLPYAVLLGVMATFLTMIPFLGAIATCLAALVIAFVQFGDWKHPLMVLAVFGVVQTLEGFVIQPKIMGERTGLHPLTIIIAVMVGTTLLGGILGGVLAIPLTAAGKVLMLRYVWKKREA
jgi:predicted PurR-regulated permease PerM